MGPRIYAYAYVTPVGLDHRLLEHLHAILADQVATKACPRRVGPGRLVLELHGTGTAVVVTYHAPII